MGCRTSRAGKPWWDFWAEDKAVGATAGRPVADAYRALNTRAAAVDLSVGLLAPIAVGAEVASEGLQMPEVPDRALALANARPSAQGDTAAPVPPVRRITYTAHLQLRVANQEAAVKQVKEIAERMGGFIQKASLESVTFRLPPDKFEPAIEALAGLGEIAQREVEAEDVTAQYADLRLRLEVAETSRQRLLTLLKNAKETKDILEIERDLRRLTEEIEKIEGALRVMDDRINWATITVDLFAKTPSAEQQVWKTGSPFAWVRELGVDNALASSPGSIDDGSILFGLLGGPGFRLAAPRDAQAPEGFALLRLTASALLAATPENYRLRAQVLTLAQEGSPDFWAKALENQLRAVKGYQVSPTDTPKPAQSGLECRAFQCETEFGGQTWAYDVWVVQKNGGGVFKSVARRLWFEDPRKEILIIEFARLKKDKEAYDPAVEQAVRGLKY
ncbi:MAG: DUF4349 domain-containing protein [Candidatus Sumerlaeota bacterium]|nr:DUF4349 domain-containing protein [Candidatus Sumerlaeota bacterium]